MVVKKLHKLVTELYERTEKVWLPTFVLGTALDVATTYIGLTTDPTIRETNLGAGYLLREFGVGTGLALHTALFIPLLYGASRLGRFFL